MEVLEVGTWVKFMGKIHQILTVTRPIDTYEIYELADDGQTKRAFRYQLEPVKEFDSDDDELLVSLPAELGAGDLCAPAPPQVQPTRTAESRFVSCTDAQLDAIELKKNEKNTDKQTDWGVRVFKDWSRASGLSADFEVLSAEEMNGRLRRFYVEARTRKGEPYSKSALNGIRAAINRHLNAPPFSLNLNLMQDKPFRSSNSILVGVIKEHKRSGMDVTVHKEPISDGDLQKLYASETLSCLDPTSLVRKVWFDIEYHFGRRGREGLRDLRASSFVFLTDDTGTEYVMMAYNESDKTHHGIDSREQNKRPRMYASGDDKCPLASLRLYLSKRNKTNDNFFQRPLKNPTDDCWYTMTKQLVPGNLVT